MAERVVKVTITAAVNSYLSGMDQVAKKARENRTEAEALTQKLEAQQRAFSITGTTMVAAGGLIAAGLAVAVKRAADFDAAMSNVQAATHETSENMALLREAAIDAGAATVYSAQESASAIEELSKAGISTADILGGGLTGALSLAAAGGLELATAAEVAATTLQQFRLSGDQASHVADVLAAGAGKAMGDVEDLSQALSQSGTVAAQFGISLEETVGSLAAFASAGLLGSDAGTSFRSMLLRLANPTKEVTAKMKELGISAYDAQGQFVGIEALAGQLKSQLSGLTQEQRNASLAIIFGQDAIRAANVLYNEGAEGIAKWTSEVDETGYAAETAATKLDNLNGDLEKLSGAFDSALISIGTSGQGPLRALVQGLTEVVDSFNGLPDSAQTAVFWVGAAASAALIGGGVFLAAVPKIAAYRAAIELLGPAAQKASSILSTAGKLAGGFAVGAAATAGAAQLLAEALRNLGDSAENVGNRFATAKSGVDLFEAAMNKNIAGSANTKQATAALKDLKGILGGDTGGNSGGLVSAVTLRSLDLLGEEFSKLANTDLPTAQRQFRLLAESANLNREEQLKLLDKLPQFQAELVNQATAANEAADGQNLLKLAMGSSARATEQNVTALAQLEGKAAEAGESVDDLADRIRGFGSATLDTRDAARGFEQAVADLSTSLKDNGDSLDISTQKGRDNQAAVDAAAQSTLTWAAAVVQQTGDQNAAGEAISEGRRRLIELLGQFNITGQAAEDYADSLGLIRENINTAVTLSGIAQAGQEIDRFITANNGRQIRLQVAADGISSITLPNGMVATSRATGGIIPGPPSSKDNVIAALATGEFVTRAAVVADPNKRRWLEYVNAGGALPAYATGGYVRPSYATPSYRGGGGGVAASSGAAEMTWLRQEMREIAKRPVQVVLDGRVIAESVNGVNKWG